jgi:hypothetical protein
MAGGGETAHRHPTARPVQHRGAWALRRRSRPSRADRRHEPARGTAGVAVRQTEANIVGNGGVELGGLGAIARTCGRWRHRRSTSKIGLSLIDYCALFILYSAAQFLMVIKEYSRAYIRAALYLSRLAMQSKIAWRVAGGIHGEPFKKASEAETLFKQTQKAKLAAQGSQAMADYVAAGHAVRANTARLRELRLAKEAADKKHKVKQRTKNEIAPHRSCVKFIAADGGRSGSS